MFPADFRATRTSYNMRIRSAADVTLKRAGSLMRTALVQYFHETVNYSFNSVIETMGPSVRDLIYEHLERKGIPAADISTRFDDVVQILTESFGESARVLVYRTLVELYQQYSMRLDFTYQDSLKDHMSLLGERVITDHLVPKRVQREDPSLDGRSPVLVQASSQSFRFK